MTGGRPLRFLGIVLSGWIGMRAIAIYRAGDLPLAGPVEHLVAALAIGRADASVATFPIPAARDTPRQGRTIRPAIGPTPVAALPPARATPDSRHLPGTLPAPTPTPSGATPALLPLAMPLSPAPPARSRLTGSAWGIARGGGIGQASGGQLGGSQVGLRLTYALDRSRRVALAARLSTPLGTRGAEAALGLDWQPTRLPVHIVAERRIALDGGRGATMLGVIGGFGPSSLAGRVTAEGYGQAGMIARDGTQAFVDGALRIAHPIAASGKTRIDLGLGSWGGAQRGAARLDIGPSLGIVLPVARHRLRLTADWRQRIAGDARPDSGPALSIGTDF